jgi:hypothetical protein
MKLIVENKDDINKINSNITELVWNITDKLPTTIPNSVTHLTFGHDYNQPTTIPNSVIELNLYNNFNKFIFIQ